MRNAEYWAERALNELLMGERSVLEYEDALLQAYTIALREIKKDIDILGWKNYVKEYTAIILAIVLIAYFQYITLTDVYLNYIWGLLLDLFIYATQFLGIGAVYSQIKEKKLQLDKE